MTADDLFAVLKALELDMEGEKAELYGRLAYRRADALSSGSLANTRPPQPTQQSRRSSQDHCRSNDQSDRFAPCNRTIRFEHRDHQSKIERASHRWKHHSAMNLCIARL